MLNNSLSLRTVNNVVKILYIGSYTEIDINGKYALIGVLCDRILLVPDYNNMFHTYIRH